MKQKKHNECVTWTLSHKCVCLCVQSYCETEIKQNKMKWKQMKKWSVVQAVIVPVVWHSHNGNPAYCWTLLESELVSGSFRHFGWLQNPAEFFETLPLLQNPSENLEQAPNPAKGCKTLQKPSTILKLNHPSNSITWLSSKRKIERGKQQWWAFKRPITMVPGTNVSMHAQFKTMQNNSFKHQNCMCGLPPYQVPIIRWSVLAQ